MNDGSWCKEEHSEASPPASSPPVPQPQSPIEDQPLAAAKDKQDMAQEAPQQEDQFQERARRLTPSADAQVLSFYSISWEACDNVCSKQCKQ